MVLELCIFSFTTNTRVSLETVVSYFQFDWLNISRSVLNLSSIVFPETSFRIQMKFFVSFFFSLAILISVLFFDYYLVVEYNSSCSQNSLEL